MGVSADDAAHFRKATYLTVKLLSMKTRKVKGNKKPKVKQGIPKIPAGRKKAGSSNIIMTMLSLGAVGLIGYFGWQYVKRKRGKTAAVSNDPFFKPQQDNATLPGTDSIFKPPLSPIKTAPPSVPTEINIPNINIPVNTGGRGSNTATKLPSDSFPLKKGSKGEQVRLFQQGLIAKYGASILPRYGADGDFGSEVAAALKKLKLPTTVSESLYNVLTQESASAAPGGLDVAGLAKNIFTATQKKDISGVLSSLKKINSVSEYQQVNTSFQLYRLNGGVRKTLVNGILTNFTDENQKAQIRYEFVRMGLRYDGSKWSLSGVDGKTISTKEPATIWINATKSITVPAKMVLGVEVSRRLDYTLFENNNKYFLVQSRSVTYM